MGSLLLARVVIPLRYPRPMPRLGSDPGAEGPVDLFLPNHPGHVDLILILTTFYRAPLGRCSTRTTSGRSASPAGDAASRRPVPDLDRPSREARREAEHAVEEVIAGLDAARTSSSGRRGGACDGVELCPGAPRALADILQAVPRPRWSSCGPGASGGACSPSPAPAGLRISVVAFAMGSPLLANLIVSCPAPDVTNDDRADRTRRYPRPDRDAINPFFEDWYNHRWPGTAALRPLAFPLRSASRDFPTASAEGEAAIDQGPSRDPRRRRRDHRGSPGPPSEEELAGREVPGRAWAGQPRP